MRKYFTIKYDECKSNFFKNLNTEQSRKSFLPIPSNKDSSLGIDFLYIPAKSVRTRFIVLCSGLHGIETYAGSALQQIFWREFENELDRENTGYLFIHGINAYGFKYYRRFTENNIDLNRNFDINSDLFLLKNIPYKNLHFLINSFRPLKNPFLEDIRFYFNIMRSIVTYGVPSLNQYLPQGQYEFPEGIFYGGRFFEPHVKIIEDILKPLIDSYKYTFVFDIHTGVGKPGKMHIIEAPSASKSLNTELVKSVFDGHHI